MYSYYVTVIPFVPHLDMLLNQAANLIRYNKCNGVSNKYLLCPVESVVELNYSHLEAFHQPENMSCL